MASNRKSSGMRVVKHHGNDETVASDFQSSSTSLTVKGHPNDIQMESH